MISWRNIVLESIFKLIKISINYHRLFTIYKNCKKKCKIFWMINYQSMKSILLGKYFKRLIVLDNYPKIKIPLQLNKFLNLLSTIVFKNTHNNAVKYSLLKLILKINKVTVILRSVSINLTRLKKSIYLVNKLLDFLKIKFNKNK